MGISSKKCSKMHDKSRLRDRAIPAGATWRCLAGEYYRFFIASKTSEEVAEAIHYKNYYLTKRGLLILQRRKNKNKTMANHKSSKKRIKQTITHNTANRYYAKTARNAVRKLRATTDKAEAEAALPKVSAMLDKLAKKNVIHPNKAGNLKSKLAKYINKL